LSAQIYLGVAAKRPSFRIEVAGEVLADGQTQEMYGGEQFADGQIQEMYGGE